MYVNSYFQKDENAAWLPLMNNASVVSSKGNRFSDVACTFLVFNVLAPKNL